MTEMKQPDNWGNVIAMLAFAVLFTAGVSTCSQSRTITYLLIDGETLVVTYWNYRDYITYWQKKKYVTLCKSKSGEYWRCKQNRMNVAYQDLTPETPPTEQDKRIVKELKFRGVLK